MNYYFGIDIGGSWIKGMLMACDESQSSQQIARLCKKEEVVKVKSNLGKDISVDVFLESLRCLLEKFHIERYVIKGVGISAAGIVRYDGTGISLCASHLSALMSGVWIDYLKEKTNAPVVLINDAEATAIGAANLGYLEGDKVYGIAPIGTGLGFVVLKNGRRWNLNNQTLVPLLGSIYSTRGNYDSLASASRLASMSESNTLDEIISNTMYESCRCNYLDDLAGIFFSAGVIYGTEEICISGGLANAAASLGWDIEKELNRRMELYPGYNQEGIRIRVLEEGNLLPLIGAILLARGSYYALKYRFPLLYADMKTENAHDISLRLDQMSVADTLEKLFGLEQEAGNQLRLSLPVLETIIGEATAKLSDGGRLIYVGCGTSGRLASIDAVELACTFGFPRDKVLTFISGGVVEAAVDIERHFEEDASSVPELLMANLSSKDVVIGISVSGRANYVQSALAYAKGQNAMTVMIQAVEARDLPFCQYVLSLNSGPELIAGSTRMKAGTATKKLLNFFSTSVMIQLGKVHGCYMTELECLNEKLVDRAVNMLVSLFDIAGEDASLRLKENNYSLAQTIRHLL